MDKTIYLYGIMQDELQVGEMVGIDGHNPLFLIGDDSLQAVVSYVDNTEYSEEALAQKTEDLNWLLEKAALHMEIIKKLHSQATIIPIKFCTLYLNEKGILETLEKYRLDYQNLLNQLKGMDEYGIKIYVQESDFAPPELEEARLELERLITGAGKGKAFLLKKNHATKIAEKKEELLGVYKEKIWQTLLGLNSSGKVNKNVSSELTGKKERMVLNSAFLVAKAEGMDFIDKANLALQEYSIPGIEMEVSGPWPPYNFCTKEIMEVTTLDNKA